MTDPGDRAEEIEYWRRWRAASRAAPPVDAVLLAAYAEGRLDETEAEPVEAWLADHPETLEDLIAARAAATEIHAAAPQGHILRAAALVHAPAAEVVPFPLARVASLRNWRDAAAWGAVAASLLVTSMFGFELGSSAYANLTQPPSVAAESTAHELLDPPTGLFSEDEEPAI